MIKGRRDLTEGQVWLFHRIHRYRKFQTISRASSGDILMNWDVWGCHC